MMVELARHHGAGPISLTEMADHESLPRPYLEQLVVSLREAGLVQSTRGAHGGYQLTRPATAISAAGILDALEGGPVAITECSGKDSHCGIEHVCRVGHAWQRVNLAIRRTLSEISLAQLAGLESGGARAAEANVEFRGSRSPPRMER